MKKDDPLTLELGVLTMPMTRVNFRMGDGSCPLNDAVIEMCNDVLNETVEKLFLAAQIMCKKNGIRFRVMDTETMKEMAKQGINKDDGTSVVQTFTGAMSDDGKPILDEDYAKAARDGKVTKN